MPARFSIFSLVKVLFRPKAAFEALAAQEPPATRVFFGFALMAVVGAPLAIGSVIHLYPHAFINLLVLVPTLIWSMYLLYRGLPVVLHTGPNRGMLMASALIAYLLVAAVSLLGVTVALWGSGLGPLIGT